ncbi:hypothetical protein BC938DRAFT_481571 [Jimgerdemannia flammicorona]|uniref:Zn(2)-C6 fungal-type domain-containing protein n=1 Tax=Jimgerdemannia flammicorona TaxID=994334 RepID=A0A433QG01_9FUNG|nr:hypothetical protein BC938DRAFT_481571 [Jimgerdemannia flammicorona]
MSLDAMSAPLSASVSVITGTVTAPTAINLWRFLQDLPEDCLPDPWDFQSSYPQDPLTHLLDLSRGGPDVCHVDDSKVCPISDLNSPPSLWVVMETGTAGDDQQQQHRKTESRIRQACDYCRTAHRKCGGGLPCNRCAKLSKICRYSSQKPAQRRLR